MDEERTGKEEYTQIGQHRPQGEWGPLLREYQMGPLDESEIKRRLLRWQEQKK